MKGFTGFPDGKLPYTPVPNLFFSELLPDIDHLGELKVTLHIFWLLAQKKGEHRYVSGEELAADDRLLDGLVTAGMSPGEALREALERAVVRRTLLRVILTENEESGAGQRDWYFVNTEKGREAFEGLLAGRWTPRDMGQSVRLEAYRPNIFVMYEQNIGPLVPMMTEELKEAEKLYPASWLEDAFREAVELNKRSWRYIQRILERWAAEGKGDEASRRDVEGDRRRYIEGEYADYIEH